LLREDSSHRHAFEPDMENHPIRKLGVHAFSMRTVLLKRILHATA
jgi:hypothetical protein